MHLILTGATGLVGSSALHYMLTTPTVTKITILSRRPVPMIADLDTTHKANVIIHKDYTQYPDSVLAQLHGADGCVWAQGISYTEVTSTEYEAITVTSPLAAAQAFANLNDPKPFNFVYVSGEGATTKPSFLSEKLSPFGPVKGRAEAALLALSKTQEGRLLRPFSLRPGGVYAGDHAEIQPYIPKLTGLKKIFYPMMYPVFTRIYSPIIAPTRELGKVLVELAMSSGERLEGVGVEAEGRTINNVGMRARAGL